MRRVEERRTIELPVVNAAKALSRAYDFDAPQGRGHVMRRHTSARSKIHSRVVRARMQDIGTAPFTLGTPATRACTWSLVPLARCLHRCFWV